MTKKILPHLTPIKIAHKNPWFSVYDRAGYFTIETDQIHVATLVVIDNKEVVLVRVKRPVVEDETWELPAGGSNDGETPLQGAIRETEEETGIQLNGFQVHQFAEFCVCPNRFPGNVQVFIVDIDQETYEKRKLHDSEVVEVRKFTFDEIKKMIANSDIYVVLPIAALSRLMCLRT